MFALTHQMFPATLFLDDGFGMPLILSPRNPITMSSERPGRCRAISPWCPRTKATVLTVAWARLLTVVHLPWKLVTGLCLSAAWMLFFLVPFCLGKKNPFNFPLPALFSQFLDACCLRKWWRHPASTCSKLFQSRRLATAIVLENPLASCATMRPGVNAICYEPPLESR